MEMQEYPNLIEAMQELDEEERAELRGLYNVLYMGAVRKSRAKKGELFRDYVKPFLEYTGAEEGSLLQHCYESFILGVNAGIEYANFMNNSSEE